MHRCSMPTTIHPVTGVAHNSGARIVRSLRWAQLPGLASSQTPLELCRVIQWLDVRVLWFDTI